MAVNTELLEGYGASDVGFDFIDDSDDSWDDGWADDVDFDFWNDDGFAYEMQNPASGLLPEDNQYSVVDSKLDEFFGEYDATVTTPPEEKEDGVMSGIGGWLKENPELLGGFLQGGFLAWQAGKAQDRADVRTAEQRAHDEAMIKLRASLKSGGGGGKAAAVSATETDKSREGNFEKRV